MVLIQAIGGMREEVKLKVGGDEGDALPSDGDPVCDATDSAKRAFAI
jgi:hypothetical protein